MTDGGHPDTHNLRTILCNTSAEIARLSELITPIEEMLEESLAQGTFTDLLVLQNLDILAQTITNVAEFLACVSDGVPVGIQVDIRAALAGVCLEASKHRLGAGHV